MTTINEVYFSCANQFREQQEEPMGIKLSVESFLLKETRVFVS